MPSSHQSTAAPHSGENSSTMPAMMLMIAKKIVQPFDAASPSVESATMPSTIHMIPTRMPTNIASHAVACPQVQECDDAGDDEQDAEGDVADARPPALRFLVKIPSPA